MTFSPKEFINRKRPYTGLFLFPFVLLSILQGMAFHPRITAIEIKGNEKTLDYIIEREIQHRIGVPLDSTMAKADRNRLENLGIFSDVEWFAIPLEDGTAILSFRIMESIQRTPPGVLPTYEEDTGWSLVGGWIIKNFRGRNQTLQLGGSIGGKDTYGLNFVDPWIFGNHISFALNLGRSIYNHNFLERIISINSFKLGLGKWFGNNIKTSTGLKYERKTFSNDYNSSSFLYFVPDFSITYDTRDIYWNPSRGVRFSQYVYHMEGIQPQNYSLTFWRQSYSGFIKLNSKDEKLIFAVNTSINRKWGDKDEFWLNYFGDSFTIRGWLLPTKNLYSSLKESWRFGHESIHATVELRKDIIPKYVTSYGTEFGLGVVAFYDIGKIANDWQKLMEISPMSGAGFGIRIPFPMIDVLRFDYGWGYRNGEWNSGAFHWGIQQKF